MVPSRSCRVAAASKAASELRCWASSPLAGEEAPFDRVAVFMATRRPYHWFTMASAAVMRAARGSVRQASAGASSSPG